MNNRSLLILAALAVAPVLAGAQATLIDDFSGGVTQANEPNPGNFNTWYDATDNTFGTPSLSSGRMQVADGGFANGVYRIYSAVVPSTGSYTVSAIMSLTEDTVTPRTDGIRALQIGASVGASAAHRASTAGADLLAGQANFGTYGGTLNTSDNSANAPQYVESNLFAATAGDNLLIAFGTDVTSGAWTTNSGTWGSSVYFVDDIKLELNGLPVELDSYSVD